MLRGLSYQFPCLMLAAMLSIGADRAPVSAVFKPISSSASNARGVTSELMVDQPVITTPVAVVNESRKSAPSVQYRWMEVTAYCPCQKCCGPAAQGITASGLPVSHNQGRFVAADTKVLPFGSQIVIPGYHNDCKVPVIDRGGAIKGARIDVFYPTHQEALEWGRRWVMVGVVSE